MNATLEPKVLRWAREKSGLSESDLAHKVGVSLGEVKEWESNGSIPFEAVEPLAEKTHTPFGFLFLKEPPELKLPVADFRKVHGASAKPSQELVDTIYSAQLRQNWFREHLIAKNQQPLPFVGKSSVNVPSVETASDICETLKIGHTLSSKTKNWEETLRMTFESIEDARILVLRAGIAGGDTHRKLSVDEFRGFALSDNYAPLVFVNGADAPSAQMFTLAHELAHIWIGESGVSNLEMTYSQGGIAVEDYCNKVAAEVLFPMSHVRMYWRRDSGLEHEADRLSKQYKISRIVVARRGRDAGFVTKTEYDTFFKMEMGRFKRSSGGNWYLNTQYQNSKRFAVSIIQDAREGRTLYRDAMRLLGIKKEETFRKFAESLHVGW